MGSFTKVPTLIPLLDYQMEEIKKNFPRDLEIVGALLIGSCSSGTATYRSDIDILVVLKEGRLTYDRVKNIRDQFESHFQGIGKEELLNKPLPVEITVVMSSVFSTIEPAMKGALSIAHILYDPDRCLLKKIGENAA